MRYFLFFLGIYSINLFGASNKIDSPAECETVIDNCMTTLLQPTNLRLISYDGTTAVLNWDSIGYNGSL